jgi:F-type H+-transporting ATPase subunit alpha
VSIIYAGINGFLDAIEVSQVGAYERELHRFLETRYPGVVTGIMEKKTIDDQLKGDLEAALKEFTKEFQASRKTVAA